MPQRKIRGNTQFTDGQLPWREDRLIKSLPSIASYLDISVSSVRDWIKKHAFPAGKLPNGLWCTTPTLIDAWLLARNPYHVRALKLQAEQDAKAHREQSVA